MSSLEQIITKKDGIDICAKKESFFIIRADIECYLKSTNLNRGSDLKILFLRDEFRKGKHYLATPENFYMIKEDIYQRVNNLEGIGEINEFSLHANCRDGDHYFAKGEHFYIFFKKKNKYRRVTNMNKDSEAKEYEIHPDCREGLYYWATDKYFYFLKYTKDNRFQYHRTTNLNKNEDPKTFTLNLDVINFLPGGLTINNEGPAFGRWEKIKSNGNDGSAPFHWEQQIKIAFGFNRKKLRSEEHHWDVDTTVTQKVGDPIASLASAEISLSLGYGGKEVSTTEEEWREWTETTEKIDSWINPGETVYVWQYRMGLGEKKFLYCRDLKLTNSNIPPTGPP